MLLNSSLSSSSFPLSLFSSFLLRVSAPPFPSISLCSHHPDSILHLSSFPFSPFPFPFPFARQRTTLSSNPFSPFSHSLLRASAPPFRTTLIRSFTLFSPFPLSLLRVSAPPFRPTTPTTTLSQADCYIHLLSAPPPPVAEREHSLPEWVRSWFGPGFGGRRDSHHSARQIFIGPGLPKTARIIKRTKERTWAGRPPDSSRHPASALRPAPRAPSHRIMTSSSGVLKTSSGRMLSGSRETSSATVDARAEEYVDTHASVAETPPAGAEDAVATSAPWEEENAVRRRRGKGKSLPARTQSSEHSCLLCSL